MRIKPVRLFCLPLLLLSTALYAEDNILTIYQQAVEFDPNLKAARYQLEISQEQRAQAGSALLPQISASANITSNEQFANSASGTSPATPANNYGGRRYFVNFNQSLFDAGKFLNWERYYSIVDQQEAAQQDALQNLMYSVLERYFKVLENQDALDLVQQEISSTRAQLEQLQHLFAKQLVKVTDMYELEAKLDSLEADKIAAETLLVTSKQGLMELSGHEITQLVPLADSVAFVPLQGEIDAYVEKAKAVNPSLLAQKNAVAAAKINIDQQKAKHLPTIEAQANYTNSNYGYQGTQSTQAEVRTIGLNINVPLFSGGGTTHAIAEASSNLEFNKQKQQSILGALIKDIHDAFLSTNASVQRIGAAEKALRSSTKAREAMEKGFQYNMQTISDVLLSQAREYKAKRDILQAKYEYIKQRSRFERYTGQIDEAYLAEINAWLRGLVRSAS